VRKPLVIVESPTKVRTIKKYIGNKFNVTATSGHIKDLPEKEIGVDIEKEFQPKYVSIKGKQKVIKSLKAAAENASDVYLAPDPDREGEAIAFHTAQILKKKGRKFYRILFHELTKNGITEGIASTMELNQNKYDAQQARRILDRLVGYQLSPLLWRKVRGGLSAGRVQSVAVRIICDRERAIQAFDPEEYWSITALLEGDKPPQFEAKLVKKDGKKIKIPDENAATEILDHLSNDKFVVDKIIKKTTKRNPLPPFITSKLQQESIRKLKFTAKKTMSIAQQLYEGVDLGPGEPEGLITYMRTDSTRIADEAAKDALKFIQENFGKDYVIDKPRFFKNKNKSQDAHEAIRPTSVFNTPEKLKSFLSDDQYVLYTLIWKRFVASQMTQALIDQNSVLIKIGRYTFSLTGSSVKFQGFMKLYLSIDDTIQDNKEKKTIPELKEGMELKQIKIDPKQHFTQPPPRFSEASLVKELEENGIGRPSTYASILSVIRDKGYVDLVNKYFRPNELGFLVNDLLVENFPNILNVDFTADLETDLDHIEAGETAYIKFLAKFYGPFAKKLESAKTDMLSIKGVGVATDLSCPECEKPLNIKIGKNGTFLSCSMYPECTFSSNYTRDEKGKVQPVEISHEIAEGRTCQKCSKPMIVRHGRYGEFLACSGYPECNHTESVNSSDSKGQSTGVKCPEEDCTGEIMERKSRRGKTFFGCSRFPDCTFALWDKPIAKKCPQCDANFIVEKTTKKEGTFLKCMTKGCGFKG
jgi:DNA topoisomerase-1